MVILAFGIQADNNIVLAGKANAFNQTMLV